MLDHDFGAKLRLIQGERAMPNTTLAQRVIENQASTNIQHNAAVCAKKIQKNAQLNAFINSNTRPPVHANTDSALYGISLAIKDNIHVAGMPSTAGTPALDAFVPRQSASVVDKLLNAGAFVAGKANMHELAFGITSDNTHYGRVDNPAAPGHLAGGSSGGTAAAIAAGLVDAGLGTDTGGSVRIPAALTGTAGFRPSMGRYPDDGICKLSPTRDTIGPMAKTAQDLALLDSVITGDNKINEVKLTTLRLGLARDTFFSNLDPHTADVMTACEVTLSKAGVTLVDIDFADIEQLIQQSGFPIVFYESVRALEHYLKDNNTGLSMQQLLAKVASPDVQATLTMALGGGAISEQQYLQALVLREKAQQLFAQRMTAHNVDALLLPCTALPARPVNDDLSTIMLNGKQLDTFSAYIRNTDPASVLGTPALCFAAPTKTNTLPVGIELNGQRNSDRHLLSIAIALETLLEE